MTILPSARQKTRTSRLTTPARHDAERSLVHAFATNLRFEDDEYNFVKTRAQVGTSEAFTQRDTHFGVDGLP